MIVKFSKWLQVVQANGESVLNRRGKKIIFLIFNFENFKQFKVDFSLVAGENELICSISIPNRESQSGRDEQLRVRTNTVEPTLKSPDTVEESPR